MRLSKKMQYMWLAILLLINIFLRYPFTPHEIGWDSFYIHSFANSITLSGYIKWWLTPLSIFGLHPYSYASAVPLILSGMSQTTGLNMECTIWIFSVIEGVLAALFAYIMAGEIKNNEYFKFMVALAFSISSGLLWFTTWTVSTRGMLIVFIPLFIYFLLKTHKSSKIKYGSLCIAIFVVSMATHKLYISLIFILVAYYGSIIFYRLKRLPIYIKIPRRVIFLFLIVLFGFLFYLPFLNIGMEWFSYYIDQNLGYKEILILCVTYGGRIGILVFIGILGFITLSYKNMKNRLDLFLIALVLLHIPFLFLLSYISLSILILASILIGLGFLNLKKFLAKKTIKLTICATITIIIVAVNWAGLAQVWHPGVLEESESELDRYLTEENYNTAMWLKININHTIISEDGTLGVRLSTFSNKKFLLPQRTMAIINELINPEEISYSTKEWTNPGFWIDGPYKEEGVYFPSYYFLLLRGVKDTEYAKNVLENFDIEYFVSTNGIDSNFGISVSKVNYKIYEEKDVLIWTT